jgi:hypothetical protein
MVVELVGAGGLVLPPATSGMMGLGSLTVVQSDEELLVSEIARSWRSCSRVDVVGVEDSVMISSKSSQILLCISAAALPLEERASGARLGASTVVLLKNEVFSSN